MLCVRTVTMGDDTLCRNAESPIFFPRHEELLSTVSTWWFCAKILPSNWQNRNFRF